MSDIEVFEIDDDFDPLEDAGLDFEEDTDDVPTGQDYQMPIPDADKSVIPEKVELPPEERIANLLKGIPGQKYRILTGIKICTEPKTLEEASTQLDEAYPSKTSVYSSARIIQLLEEAGALLREGEEEAEVEAVTEEQAEAELAIDDGDERVESISLSDIDAGYEDVEPVEPATYTATAEGLAALEENWSLSRVIEIINAEPQYLPIWKQCLEMCAADGGASKKDIAAEVDDNELLKKPRRWCQYFLGKLGDTAALKFEGTWQITDLGREALESELFAA